VSDPAGCVVARAAAAEEAVLLADIDLAAAGECHARRLFLRDRRPEIVPRLLGL